MRLNYDTVCAKFFSCNLNALSNETCTDTFTSVKTQNSTDCHFIKYYTSVENTKVCNKLSVISVKHMISATVTSVYLLARTVLFYNKYVMPRLKDIINIIPCKLGKCFYIKIH